MKKIAKELMVLLFAAASTVALFADVESTGNLSMALNGDGIPQLAALILLAFVYRRVWIAQRILTDLDKRKRLSALITALLFALFMIIGKAQNAEPDLKYEFFAGLLFIGYVPFFYILVSYMGKLLDKYASTCRIEEERKTPGKLTCWLFEEHVTMGVMLVVFLCRLPYLIAFFPCSMSWDGGAQICNFYGIETFSNHHPPLLSYLYGAVAFYSQEWGIPNLGMFLIPVLQTMLSAFAIARVCVLFQRLKTPYCIRWGGLLFYGAFTVWCIFDVTVIKDTIYWPLTLLFTVSLVDCVVLPELFWEKKRNLFLMILYGILMTQTRNNGIFVLVFTLPVLLILVKNKKKLIFGCALAAMFVIIYLINNVLYPAMGVINLEAKEDTYCILFQQTAKYGQDYPEDVTDEEREFLDKMFDYDELVEVYNPQLADWVKNCLRISEASSADGTNIEFAAIKDAYFKVWFAQFLRHPLSYFNTFLECSYGYYYPEARPYKEGTGFYEMDRHMFTEGLHEARQIEALAPARFLLEQVSKLEYAPGIGLLYRCGFYTWCIVFAVLYLAGRRNYKELLITLPAAVNILVCLISPVNTCIRYALPTMCMIPLILGILILAQIRKGSDINGQQ